MTEASKLPSVELYSIDAEQDNPWPVLFTRANRQSKKKLVIVTNADKMRSWNPLAAWLSKSKNVLAVFETESAKVGFSIEKKLPGSSLVVDCSNGTRNRRSQFMKYIGNQYSLAPVQTKSLFEYSGWHISDALGIFDKCKLLGVKPSVQAINVFATPDIAQHRFIRFLLENKKTDAYKQIVAMPISAVPDAMIRLEEELLLLSRIKSIHTAMKKTHEIAAELGVPTAEVEENLAVSKLYNPSRIANASLSLANADRQWTKGNTIGVLETLIRTW